MQGRICMACGATGQLHTLPMGGQEQYIILILSWSCTCRGLRYVQTWLKSWYRISIFSTPTQRLLSAVGTALGHDRCGSFCVVASACAGWLWSVDCVVMIDTLLGLDRYIFVEAHSHCWCRMGPCEAYEGYGPLSTYPLSLFGQRHLRYRIRHP
jgi:hypothetical protein